MATMYISAEPFILRSSWINQYDGEYYIKTTKPSMAKHSALFATSAIPAGSVLQSAILKITRTTLIGGDFYANGVKNENLVDVTDRITQNADGTFNDADVAFSFTGWGETGTEKPYGTRTAVANVKGATLEITYTEGQGVATDKTAYRAAALASSREITMRGIIKYADGSKQPITADNIISFSVNEGDDGGILIGAAPSAQIDLVLANADGEWLLGGGMRENRELIGARITIEIGLRVNGEFVYTPGGTFVIDEMVAEESTPTMTVRGYDEMANAFLAKYNDRNVYPASLSDILADIIGQSGFSQTGVLAANRVAMIPKKPDWGEECTLRQALAFVCGAGASFATITREGKVAIKPAWNDSEPLTLDPESYISLSIDEREFAFNRIVVTPRGAKEEKDDLVAYVNSKTEELPSNTIYIDDNPLIMKGWNISQTIVNGIRDALTGAQWHAISTTWRGDPTVEVGTRVHLTNLSGKTIVSTVMAQGLEWESGFNMTASCSIPTKEVYTAGGLTGAGMIDTKKIAIEGISNKHLESDSVTADKIKAGSITSEKIDAGAITADKIAAGVLSADLIEAGSITTDKLAAGSITADKMAAGVLSADLIDAGSITTDKLAAGAVTADKIASGAITAIGIQAGSITTDKLAAGAVTAEKIKAGEITAVHIAGKTITAEQLAAGLITANSGLIANSAIGTAQIADGSITSAKIISLNADVIDAGTLKADRLLLVGDGGVIYEINAQSSGLSMTELQKEQYQKYLNGTVIVAKSITAAQIAAKTITANEILAGTITAAEIAANAITSEKLAAHSVTANKLSSDVGSSLDLSSNIAITNLVRDVNALPATHVQFAAPSNVKKGDVWVNTGASTWADLKNVTWQMAKENPWGHYFNAQPVTKVWDGVKWQTVADQAVIKDQYTLITQTQEKITHLATKEELSGKVSQSVFDQKAEELSMRIETVDGKTPEKVVNTALTLDQSGIDMQGGQINIRAGSALTVDAPNFNLDAAGNAVMKNASVSGNLTNNGIAVLTAKNLVVSSTQPTAPVPGMVWVKPVGSTAATFLYNNTTVQSFKAFETAHTLQNAGTAVSASGSYTFNVKIPYKVTGNVNATRYLTMMVGNTAIFTDVALEKTAGTYVLELSGNLSAWLGNANSLSFTLNLHYMGGDDGTLHNVHRVDVGAIDLKLYAKSNAASGWSSTEVQVYNG